MRAVTGGRTAKAHRGMIVAALFTYLAALVALEITRLALGWSADAQALAVVAAAIGSALVVYVAGLWKSTRRTGDRAASSVVVLIAVVFVTAVLRGGPGLGPGDWLVITVVLVLPGFLVGQMAIDWRAE